MIILIALDSKLAKLQHVHFFQTRYRFSLIDFDVMFTFC